MSLHKTAILPLLLTTTLACTAGDAGSDIPFEGDADGFGKADHLGLDVTPLRADVDHRRLEKGGKVIITSADSWVEYFGTDAPADVDFDNEWVAFFGSGLQSSGGFSAEITGLQLLPGLGGLILETVDVSPGLDCIVTKALTTPHSLVKFDIPSPTPRFAVSDHSSEVHRCGPTNDERLTDLANSLKEWQAARDEVGNSYSYVRETHSFFLNGSFKTTFVVEDGVVVERVATHTSGADVDVLDFHEVGAEVGSNDGVHPVRLIDDLYEQCKNDVLSLDDQEHFINLSFDNDLLQVCTSFHRQCQDDCSRGPVITSITL